MSPPELMSLTLVALQHALFTAMSLRAYLSYPNKRHPGVPIDRYVLHIFCMISISSSAEIRACESIKPLRPADSQLFSAIMPVIMKKSCPFEGPSRRHITHG
ncbi:hypothetical protein EV702DRAFT_703055 [Suillus placidus]|uniref:Secreted protein n=1 Tax=Suillus placidus TaxID=48579 RepID=A0A9P6ZLS5_9AGAM|nr:hypothetical protein EV702DRAFT_703055 [Suillus placidus]